MMDDQRLGQRKGINERESGPKASGLRTYEAFR